MMEDDKKKQEIQKALGNAEFHLAPIQREEVVLENLSQLPLGNLAALGTAFQPLVSILQSAATGGGGNGLYYVNTKGGEMFRFKNGSGYLGSIKNSVGTVGGGQAELNPVAFNPTMMFMAAALYNIEKKLDIIQETQQEMIDFLENREKSELRGNIDYLAEVLNHYKYNWTNDQYKKANYIKVLDIKQDAGQSILFYREQIDNKLNKESLFHSDKDSEAKLGKVKSDLEGYQLALYLFAFSSFLEVMLLENYDSAYLDAIASKIKENENQYRLLYTECYNLIEKHSKSSIQSHLLSGLASVNNAAGNAASIIPGVNKSQIDKTLIDAGNKLGKYGSERVNRKMEKLISYKDSVVSPFLENINTINVLYNQPIKLLLDGENIYFGLPEKEC